MRHKQRPIPETLQMQTLQANVKQATDTDTRASEGDFGHCVALDAVSGASVM